MMWTGSSTRIICACTGHYEIHVRRLRDHVTVYYGESGLSSVHPRYAWYCSRCNTRRQSEYNPDKEGDHDQG